MRIMVTLDGHFQNVGGARQMRGESDVVRCRGHEKKSEISLSDAFARWAASSKNGLQFCEALKALWLKLPALCF